MVDESLSGGDSGTIDIDTLLLRLRCAAVDHASLQTPDRVRVSAWPPSDNGGARDAMLDAWASIGSSDLWHYLIPDPDDFVELAFRWCLGRAADPAGRGHYLSRVQQGMPRLEILVQLSASPESDKIRERPVWPLWLRPLLWALRLPSAFARRGTRAVLRRIESRLGTRARSSTLGLMWRTTLAQDNRERFRQGEWDALSQEVSATEERLSLTERESRSTQSLTDELASRLAGFRTEFDASSRAMAAMRARMAALDYTASGAPAASAAPTGSDADLTRYYVTLESVFRGETARIGAQLEADYLGLLASARTEAGDGPCVDLGCGRGEWLDVLRAHGFGAQGVDLNPAMAAVARAHGHQVIVGDALTFLRGIADDSLLAVSAFHVAEHLDFPTLFRLVAECRRVLKPWGLLILETPNPENIWVATHTFHHDPTHGNPLTPASLEFLVNHHGLETVAVPRLHPYPDEARLPGNDPVTERLNAMTCGGQDFAVVAKKTPPG